MHVTETLEDLRRLKALSQAELGEQGMVSDIECGRHLASPRTMRRFAEKLALPIERVSAACTESYRRAHDSSDNQQASA